MPLLRDRAPFVNLHEVGASMVQEKYPESPIPLN